MKKIGISLAALTLLAFLGFTGCELIKNIDALYSITGKVVNTKAPNKKQYLSSTLGSFLPVQLHIFLNGNKISTLTFLNI